MANFKIFTNGKVQSGFSNSTDAMWHLVARYGGGVCNRMRRNGFIKFYNNAIIVVTSNNPFIQ